METSRSGAGGKLVMNRRKQRLSATPYERPPPPPPPSPPPPPKSPNWFTGLIVPSARLLASGAGKILNSMLNESESSSSEDQSSASEDDFENEDHYETPCNGDNLLNEVWSTESKWTIEQLITQETFSREECDRMIKVLNSRVKEAGDISVFVSSPGKTVDNENVDIYDKAVQEAKRWFQELAHGTRNLNSTRLGHVETGGGSPVDVAKSYMKEIPPWSSPRKSIEFRTPSTTTMKLFKERTLYSVDKDSLSSSKIYGAMKEHINVAEIAEIAEMVSLQEHIQNTPAPIEETLFIKKGNSLASGSWNLQEELRRVRSKATEDMLRSSSAKIDPSWFSVGPNRGETLRAGELLFGAGERIETESLRKTQPINASVHAEEHHTDPSSSDVNGVPAIEVTEIVEKQNVQVLATSQPSSSAGRNSEQRDEKTHNMDTVEEIKHANTVNVEGDCALLSEAYMEVPVVTETDGLLANGSRNNLGMMQYEELSVDMAHPSPDEKWDIVFGKQQARKSGRNNRRGRGRGK